MTPEWQRRALSGLTCPDCMARSAIRTLLREAGKRVPFATSVDPAAKGGIELHDAGTQAAPSPLGNAGVRIREQSGTLPTFLNTSFPREQVAYA